MTLVNAKDLIDLLEPDYKAHNQVLTKEVLDGYWLPALSGHSMEDIGPAVQLAYKETAFRLTPADICKHLPDLLGHPHPEQAWAMFPKDETRGSWVSGQIMSAGAMVEELILKKDLIAARKSFLATYEDLVKKSRFDGEAANFFWTGERDKIFISETINAVNLGLITNQRGRKAIKTACRAMAISKEETDRFYQKLPQYHDEEIEPTLWIENDEPIPSQGVDSEKAHNDAYQSREPSNTYDLARKMHENMTRDKIWHHWPSLESWTLVLNKLIRADGYELEKVNEVWAWLCDQKFEVRNEIPNAFYFEKRFSELLESMKGG